MRRRLREPLRSERGAVGLIFAVLLLGILIPLGAIAVDVGFWYVAQRQAQTAADAGALAAAAEIPSCASVTSEAEAYVDLNMPSASPVVTYCGPADEIGPDEVEVEVTAPGGLFFGGIVGWLGVTVSARAVAQQENPGNLAIYVHSSDCDPPDSILFHGLGQDIDGWVHSQGGFRVESGSAPGEKLTADRGTKRLWTPGCPSSVDPPIVGAQFGPDPSQWEPEDGPDKDWPVWFTPSQFGFHLGPVGVENAQRCRYQGRRVEVLGSEILIDTPVPPTPPSIPHGGVIPAGIYCASEEILIDAPNLDGRITALAPQITVRPASVASKLRPYARNVLLFAIPNTSASSSDDQPPSPSCPDPKVMSIVSDRADWAGFVFHPCGKVAIHGGTNATLIGSIVAESVSVTGNGFNMVGEENFAATVSLVE